MLTKDQAIKIAMSAFPIATIDCVIEYQDLFVLKMHIPRPLETIWDPFYSVNRNTGEFRDFSIVTDGNTAELISLFQKEKAQNPGGGYVN
jgi:hypothetical protein